MTDIKNQFNGGTFNDPKFIYGGKTINKYLGTIPLTPDIFLGRENDLDALHEKLFQGNNMLLLVNGEGGVGKTTLAAQYYHTHSTKYTHLTWVFAEKSLRDAILTLAWPLQITFPERMTENDRLQNLLSVMIELKKPCLLVIDNANSIEDLEAHYHLLKACHNFHILLTTRITDFEHAETHAVKPLDNKRATELFVQHYPAHSPEEDNLLQEILQAVGYNTLVIELLAKNLGNFNNSFANDMHWATCLRTCKREDCSVSARVAPSALPITVTGLACAKKNRKQFLRQCTTSQNLTHLKQRCYRFYPYFQPNR